VSKNKDKKAILEAKKMATDVRTIIAIELANLPRLNQMQLELLEVIDKTDPVVHAILKTYGVRALEC